MVKNAGKASPMYAQFTSAAVVIIIEPTMTKTLPVAHGGSEEKMGAKNKLKKNIKETVNPVIPVRPPSAMPDALSTNAVHGEQPNKLPMEIESASHTYAVELPSKSPVRTSTRPAWVAIAYNVPVVSSKSKYRKIINASQACPVSYPCQLMFLGPIGSMLLHVATCLKKFQLSLPSSV